MNTDDKAKELVEKFAAITVKYVLNGEANEADVLDEAKECAIIAVDLLINESSGKDYTLGRNKLSDKEYWQEVKSKILSL